MLVTRNRKSSSKNIDSANDGIFVLRDEMKFHVANPFSYLFSPQTALTGTPTCCTTVDKEVRNYLQRLYGQAHYVVIDEARSLPLKVVEIYRRLTL